MWQCGKQWGNSKGMELFQHVTILIHALVRGCMSRRSQIIECIKRCRAVNSSQLRLSTPHQIAFIVFVFSSSNPCKNSYQYSTWFLKFIALDRRLLPITPTISNTVVAPTLCTRTDWIRPVTVVLRKGRAILEGFNSMDRAQDSGEYEMHGQSMPFYGLSINRNSGNKWFFVHLSLSSPF